MPSKKTKKKSEASYEDISRLLDKGYGEFNPPRHASEGSSFLDGFNLSGFKGIPSDIAVGNIGYTHPNGMGVGVGGSIKEGQPAINQASAFMPFMDGNIRAQYQPEQWSGLGSDFSPQKYGGITWEGKF